MLNSFFMSVGDMLIINQASTKDALKEIKHFMMSCWSKVDRTGDYNAYVGNCVLHLTSVASQHTQTCYLSCHLSCMTYS